MDMKKKATDNDNFILLITGVAPVIIESGPRIYTETATPELLADDVTAAHYAVGKMDQTGKVIVLGEPMTYADWQSKDRAWNVYQWGFGDEQWRWLKVAVFNTEIEAIQHASTLCEIPLPDGAPDPDSVGRGLPTFPPTE